MLWNKRIFENNVFISGVCIAASHFMAFAFIKIQYQHIGHFIV